VCRATRVFISATSRVACVADEAERGCVSCMKRIARKPEKKEKEGGDG